MQWKLVCETMQADTHDKRKVCRLKGSCEGQVLVEGVVDSDMFFRHFENLG